MRQINKIIKKGENLLKKIGAEINRTQGVHGIPIDIYMNDCLKYIDTVNNLKNINKKQKEKAKKKLSDGKTLSLDELRLALDQDDEYLKL